MPIVLVEPGGGVVTMRPTIRDRVAARVRTPSLDRALANGKSPDATPALALRAQTLVCPTTRARLAATVRRVVEVTAEPARPFSIGLRRNDIRRLAAEFQTIADRLVMHGPVPARGVAMVSTLLSDGTGPLYHRAHTAELGAVVHEALEALDPLSAW